MDHFKRVSEAVRFAQDKMKKNGLFDTERMFCDLYCFEPDQLQAPHTHEGSDKVYFVIEGQGIFQVGEEEKQLGNGEIVLAPSGVRHGVRNPGPDRLVVLVFMAPKPSH